MRPARRIRTAAAPMAMPAMAPPLRVLELELEAVAAAEVVCEAAEEVGVLGRAVDEGVKAAGVAVEIWVDAEPESTPLAVRLT